MEIPEFNPAREPVSKGSEDFVIADPVAELTYLEDFPWQVQVLMLRRYIRRITRAEMKKDPFFAVWIRSYANRLFTDKTFNASEVIKAFCQEHGIEESFHVQASVA